MFHVYIGHLSLGGGCRTPKFQLGSCVAPAKEPGWGLQRGALYRDTTAYAVTYISISPPPPSHIGVRKYQLYLLLLWGYTSLRKNGSRLLETKRTYYFCVSPLRFVYFSFYSRLHSGGLLPVTLRPKVSWAMTHLSS